MKTRINRNELLNLLTSIEELKPFWHPLGFVSCILKETEETTLKLHYWPSGIRKPKTPNWPVHDHVYDIESTILSGSIENTFYYPTSDGNKCIYKVVYDGKNSFLKIDSKDVGLQERKISKYDKGATYNIERHTFHKAYVPHSEETLTLVKKSNFSGLEPRVISSDSMNTIPVYYVRELYSTATFVNKVKYLIGS